PVPLHGIPEHRGQRAARGGAGPGRRRRAGADVSRPVTAEGAGSSLIGSRVVRREDDRLVTGRGRYLDDLGHQALAAAFVRSPHAHARIAEIDITDALDVEGLVGVYTWEDLAEADARAGTRVSELLPLLIPHPA